MLEGTIVALQLISWGGPYYSMALLFALSNLPPPMLRIESAFRTIIGRRIMLQMGVGIRLVRLIHPVITATI